VNRQILNKAKISKVVMWILRTDVVLGSKEYPEKASRTYCTSTDGLSSATENDALQPISFPNTPCVEALTVL
jgi:hypothetical protein